MSNPKAQMCILFRTFRGSGVPHRIPLFNGKQILTPGYRHATTNLLRVLGLLEVGYENLDWIVNNNYSLRLQKVSNDLLNASREMLARGEPDEISTFMRTHIQPMGIKVPHFYEVVNVLNDHPFAYNPQSVKHYLDIDIPADEFFSCSPDYSKNLEYVFDNNPLAADIRIPLSGSRSVDERRAFRFLEENGARVPTPAEMRGLLLHHKSPELMVNGELWFVGQLVQKDFHRQLWVASLKGLIEEQFPLPQLPVSERKAWELTFEAIEDWDEPSDPFNYEEFSRLLFGHVGAVKGYTEFYPGVFYKQ